MELSKWLPVTVGLCLMLKPSLPAQAAQPPFECFPTSDLERVFEDGFGLQEPRQGALTLFGLRNETISAQCVLLAHEDLEELTLSVGPLQQARGSGAIPEENVRWNFIGSAAGPVSLMTKRGITRRRVRNRPNMFKIAKRVLLG